MKTLVINLEYYEILRKLELIAKYKHQNSNSIIQSIRSLLIPVLKDKKVFRNFRLFYPLQYIKANHDNIFFCNFRRSNCCFTILRTFHEGSSTIHERCAPYLKQFRSMFNSNNSPRGSRVQKSGELQMYPGPHGSKQIATRIWMVFRSPNL